MDFFTGARDKLKNFDSKREKIDLDDFEAFMRKVEEVNRMVHALTSNDKSEIEEATENANAWLKSQKKEKRNEQSFLEEIINEPNKRAQSNKKVNKTVLNKNALNEQTKEQNQSLDNLNCESMTQEAFMKSVEEDAKKRSEDRRQRKKESDIIKVEANKAFLAKDYEKALDLYNKAIDIRKDCFALYTNRALTLLNLGLNKKALSDCETVLRFSEKKFKASVFKGRALFQMGDEEKAVEWMEEVKQMFANRTKEILEYQKSWSDENEND